MDLESSDKTCPYCAETIKAEAIKCRYCGEALLEDDSQVNSKPQSKVALCASCEVQLVTKEMKSPNVSISEIAGIIFILIGIILLFIFLPAGIILLVIGFVGALSRGKVTVMVCPTCGKKGRTI